MATQRRTRSDGRETIATVKKFAAAELEKYGAVNFNLDRVLAESGVSSSSVYHHFGSRENLIAVVALDQSLQHVIAELAIIEELANQARDQKSMFEVLMLGLSVGGTPKARTRRLRRISGLAATDSNKAIQRAMKDAQIDGTAHFIRVLESAEQRKLISPRAPIVGIAYLLQSLLVGRIVVDVTGSSGTDDAWLNTSLTALRYLLGIDDE